MSEKSYYYGIGAGEVSGPLPLSSIKIAIETGRLPATLVIAERTDGPWMPVAKVLPQLRKAKSSKPLVAASGLIGAAGYFMLLISLLACLRFFLMSLAAPAPPGSSLIYFLCVGVSLGVIALGEILGKLEQIASDLQKR